MTDDPRLRLIQAWEVGALEALAFRADLARVGGFLSTIDRHVDFDFANYAFPVGSPQLGAEVEGLRQLFNARARRLRIEVNEPAWPELPAQLRAAGLAEVERHALMIASRVHFRSAHHPGVTVELLEAEGPGEKIGWFQSIRATGSGEPLNPASEDSIERGRVWLRRGHVYALGHLDGEPAGTGASLPIGQVADVVGIATLPEKRGRGVAQVVTSALLEHLFTRGVETVFLDAEDERAHRLYEKLGFETIGDRVVFEDR